MFLEGLKVHGSLRALRAGHDYSLYAYSFDADTVFPDGVPDLSWFVDKDFATRWFVEKLDGALKPYGLKFVDDVMSKLDNDKGESEPFANSNLEEMSQITAAKVEVYAGVPSERLLALMPPEALPIEYGGTNNAPFPATRVFDKRAVAAEVVEVQ